MNAFLHDLMAILEPCLVALIGLFVTYLTKYINKKTNDIKIQIDSHLAEKDRAIAEKYTTMISNTVNNCVQSVSQTYVDALKKDDAFSKENQEEAFNRCKDLVIANLSTDAKDYIREMHYDVDSYLDTLIEATVKKNK